MRDLKFRSWDGKVMRILTLFQAQHYTEDFILREDNSEGWIDDECVEATDTIMQFTGLYASKGKGIKKGERKEVYEGDVFRHQKETDEGDRVFYSVVMWIKQRAAFYLVDASHYPILRDNDVSEERGFTWLFQDADLYDFSLDVGLPLVGNIYENTELLKPTK